MVCSLSSSSLFFFPEGVNEIDLPIFYFLEKSSSFVFGFPSFFKLSLIFVASFGSFSSFWIEGCSEDCRGLEGPDFLSFCGGFSWFFDVFGKLEIGKLSSVYL